MVSDAGPDPTYSASPIDSATVNIRLYALRLYDTLSYNWESNYVQNRPFCHCGAGEKLFLVAARTFVAHLFLYGCACVGVIHKRISTVLRHPHRQVYVPRTHTSLTVT